MPFVLKKFKNKDLISSVDNNSFFIAYNSVLPDNILMNYCNFNTSALHKSNLLSFFINCNRNWLNFFSHIFLANKNSSSLISLRTRLIIDSLTPRNFSSCAILRAPNFLFFDNTNCSENLSSDNQSFSSIHLKLILNQLYLSSSDSE